MTVTAQYPSAREYLVSQLNPSGPYNATGFLQALNFSAIESIYYFGLHNISEYFVNGLEAIYEAPELVRVFGDNEYEGYHGIPQMPLFVYKAIHDDCMLFPFCYFLSVYSPVPFSASVSFYAVILCVHR